MARGDDTGGGEMPEILHRTRRAIRRAFHRFEDVRSDEPPYVAQWDFKFRVSVEPDELDGGFVAECLDLPGCFSQGETADEALTNLDEAIRGVMMTVIEQKVASEQVATERRRRRAKTPEPREVQERPVAMKIAL
jgi:predicted RNase H-like HicB family nuclease